MNEHRMPKAEQYRQQGRRCLDLANAAEDQFSKESLRELAAEYLRAADESEKDSKRRSAA